MLLFHHPQAIFELCNLVNFLHRHGHRLDTAATVFDACLQLLSACSGTIINHPEIVTIWDHIQYHTVGLLTTDGLTGILDKLGLGQQDLSSAHNALLLQSLGESKATSSSLENCLIGGILQPSSETLGREVSWLLPKINSNVMMSDVRLLYSTLRDILQCMIAKRDVQDVDIDDVLRKEASWEALPRVLQNNKALHIAARTSLQQWFAMSGNPCVWRLLVHLIKGYATEDIADLHPPHLRSLVYKLHLGGSGTDDDGYYADVLQTIHSALIYKTATNSHNSIDNIEMHEYNRECVWRCMLDVPELLVHGASTDRRLLLWFMSPLTSPLLINEGSGYIEYIDRCITIWKQ
jgi:hypothetical protein